MRKIINREDLICICMTSTRYAKNRVFLNKCDESATKGKKILSKVLKHMNKILFPQMGIWYNKYQIK